MRGFLGTEADAYGTVITVNSTGSPDALFNSLSPGDLCPNFEDGNGGSEGMSLLVNLPEKTGANENKQQLGM